MRKPPVLVKIQKVGSRLDTTIIFPPHVPPPTDGYYKLVAVRTRPCRSCGRDMSISPPEYRSTRRYCDDTCRQKGHRSHD